MGTLLRHAAAVLILPFTVAVVVPMLLARRYAVNLSPPDGAVALLCVLVGCAALLAGLALFVACVSRFASEGRGTLAPWDPPTRLVLRGPYRFVRNPMISGVLFVLFGEALVLRSLPHLAWAVIFLVLNATYIPLVEEPQLDARFGEAYRRYRRNVRRFWPRARGWDDGAADPGRE